MIFNNKVYNIIKWIALILLPAISTLIMSLGDIWGFAYKNEVSLTIIAIDTFLGVLIGISTAGYKGDGRLIFENGSDSCVIECEEDILNNPEKTGKVLLTLETVDKLENKGDG